VKVKLEFVIPGVILAILFALPLVIDSRAVFNLLTHILVVSIFAMSYDILLGYTGIISFGHALFFGSGAYFIGLVLKNAGPSMVNVFIGLTASILFGLIIALIIGTLSLRVRDTYYAMVTLAFGELFFIAALKLRSFTGGEDGFSFYVPRMLQDRIAFYYMVLIIVVAVYVLLRTFISSPTGKVLQAIRENERRAEALGYDVFKYKLFSTVVAGITAILAGVLGGLQERFVSAAMLSTEKTIDALLMTIIGGSGTLHGAVFGSTLIIMGKEWFTRLAGVHPIFERWLILYGILFIVIVLFFPGGLSRVFSRVLSKKEA
jgi:branched-chain amino acid transport system permease protein